ncbi:methyltransferase domain-containing protein [Pseudonocardia sp.]|uniref:methyltransferase domain-containing protein n=1 Tax=Pseudonocardia sp. TaxID=60912 RepID=UPI00262DC457|nr:methyltransferase domain-containing protein [Pseudonocardia sp.]
MLEFDDDGARLIDRAYATPDVVAQRAEVLARLAPRPGERILDVGSGPGFLAASLADAVGPGGVVHGLDPSPSMNGLARARTADRPWVRIDEGDALALPYPDACFDAAVSTQVYEYVPDVAAALAELRRVLRAGGRVVVLDTDWESLVWHTADRALHRRIMAVWDEHLVDPHLPRTLPGHLRRAGFQVTDRALIPLFNPVHDPDTYSAHTMATIGSFVTGRSGVTADDVRAWTADLQARGAEGDYLFSLNRYCFTAVAG